MTSSHGMCGYCAQVEAPVHQSVLRVCVFDSALFPQTERDVSVRQRAVDLLYAMCDRSNAQQIVAEMLSYLETADYSIREEIVSCCEV
jgi:hypothetical protein